MISKNIAKYYLQSEQGKLMIKMFSRAETNEQYVEQLESIYPIIVRYLFNADDVDQFIYNVNSIKLSVLDVLDTYSVWNEETIGNFYSKLLDNIEVYDWNYCEDNFRKGRVTIKKGEYREIATLIPYISWALYNIFYEEDEEPYFPVLFNHDFLIFSKWCQILGIVIPAIPLQKDKRKRCDFYLELTLNIRLFQKEMGLSKAETCALLYGFANEEIQTEQEDDSVQSELPAPTRIWLTGASKKDYKYILTSDANTSVWACNEQTKRGDIVIIYALSPYSQIHSIWRAEKDGNVNPFDYYCNRIVVNDKIIIPPISYKELMEDGYMKNVPIVRRHLMGINGVELTHKDYCNIQRILQSKGFDTSLLPQIKAPNLNFGIDIRVEADVSEKLLIPLLSELGYSSIDGQDWKRELQLKLGRDRVEDEIGYKARPDFTFFWKDMGHDQKISPFLIECKYDMRTNNDREEAFGQAASYASQLRSNVMGICDKNLFRIYMTKRNYFDMERDLVFDRSWLEIQQPAVFNELKKLIGRDAIAKIVK